MKKSLTGMVALLAGAFVAHSQGTVEFGNYANLATYSYVTLGSTKLGGSKAGTGVAANDTGAGSEWTVALFGNATGTTPLVQLDNANGGAPVTATLETGNASDSTAGTWYSTAIANVPGTTLAGQSATVQVYAWYNDNGTYTTYAAAKAAGVPTGFSPTVTVTTGGPNSSGPPSTPSSAPFASFSVAGGTVTPEPSTIALGIMGASAFLLRLRKKQ